METRRRGEGVEENANPRIVQTRRTLKGEVPRPCHMDPSSDQAEVDGWMFGTSVGDWSEGDVATFSPVMLGLCSFRERTLHMLRRNKVLNRRRPIEDDGHEMHGYHDSVDTIREFLDSR